MPDDNRPDRAEALSFEEEFSLEMVPRQCRLEDYRKLKTIPKLKISSEFVAYASPDSTYPVTKRLFEQAQKSILIGIYDFTSLYMQELLLEAMERGVKVSLMLDIDGDSERKIFAELSKFGAECVPAPSCASQTIHYFASSHEKVIVIDDLWTMVQSGNYSNNSIPRNEKDGGDRNNFRFGNRDMGVAIKSKPLAAFFTKVLRGDMKLETDAAGQESTVIERETFPDLDLLEEAPAQPPLKLFRSKTFNPSSPIRVTPVLTPDNYMDVIPGFLESAQKSIYIEQQYIRRKQPNVQKLLASIGIAWERNPDLDIRIIIARPMSRGKDFDKDVAEIEALGEFGFEMGTHVRILNPRHFTHCHNKLLVVDNQKVLVSSQNWSDFAVVKNREAGLLMEYPELARYYAAIFKSDWETALESLTSESVPALFSKEQLNSGQPKRKMVRLSWGDYAEV
jgi:phosphatidylserine/phosphatidylglycerophosphate/cardiolipin synthase-like enzyme